MSDQTRDQIISAAYRALTRHGYHDTSVKDIAAQAGIAPGLIHYYFETKEDLLVAAIQFGMARLLAEKALPRGLSFAEEGRLQLELLKQYLRRHHDYYVLLFDMFGASLHNPKIAVAVRQCIQEGRKEIERIVLGVLPEMGSPVDAAAVSSAIWGAIHGIMLQSLIDPRFDTNGAIDALTVMAFALGGNATAGSRGKGMPQRTDLKPARRSY